ncbi:hypothetical protein L4C42_09910 [Vibrio wakamikoensis]|uniref:hypothetical protein n=1 Tax=Vibrio wakamikoensis TaxID=2910251 RepID=UPI003D25F52F
MQILEWAFILFFVFGGLLFVWFILVGGALNSFTPKRVIQYAFSLEHYRRGELALVRGFHFVALIHGVALLTAVTFPKWAKKRRLTEIRSVCSPIFIKLSVTYIYVLWILTISVLICLVTMTILQ